VTRPCTADDFPMIRARIEELRHQRARPHAPSTSPGMKVGSVSRAQLRDFPQFSPIAFSIPRPGRPKGYPVKN
jgi:hypothetical protein